MRIERRLDNRMFDELLPVHMDIDQLEPMNKAMLYICGNVNVNLYNKNTCGNLVKIIGGDYVFHSFSDEKKKNGEGEKGLEKKNKKDFLLGSGKSSVVFSTLFGPIISGQALTKDRDCSRVNVKIKNEQGNRTEREKMFEEILTRHLDKILNFHLYKYHQFHFKIQIVEECTYILASIFNAIFLNLIHCGISLNYPFSAVNVGIIDPDKYMDFVNNRYASTIFYSDDDKIMTKEHTSFNSLYDKYKNKLFHKYGEQTYIPKVILDPLQEEIDLYCSSAFTYIVSPNYNHIIGNIIFLSSTGLSNETFLVSDSYALQASKYIFKCVSETYKNTMTQLVDKYMAANRIDE